MNVDRLHEYFKNWYLSNTRRFQCGMMDDEDIAYSAFLEGYKVCGGRRVITVKNMSEYNDAINTCGAGDIIFFEVDIVEEEA